MLYMYVEHVKKKCKFSCEHYNIQTHDVKLGCKWNWINKLNIWLKCQG